MPDPHAETEKIERLREAMYSRTLSENIKERDRHALEEDDANVGDDWSHAEAPLKKTLVAPRVIAAPRLVLSYLLVLAIVFFVGSVGFFVYYFTFGAGSSSTSAENISISVVGPPQVQSGAKTELQIMVTNKNSQALQLGILDITYPDGTRSAADFTTPQPTQDISLGTIGSGETKQGVVYAVLNGATGAGDSIDIELQYHLSGSNAVYTAHSTYAYTYSSSPLSVAVSGATQTVSGQPVTLQVDVASNSQYPVAGALLSASFPFGFKLTSAQPAALTGTLWDLGTMNPGVHRVITLTGTLSGQEGDSQVFNFTAGTRSSATSSSIDVPLSSSPYTLAIAKSFLGLTVNINNASSTGVVSPGDKVTVTINYANNLASEITNAVVVAKLSGTEIDGTTVYSTDGFYRSNNDTVIWDKTTTNGALASLAPGATGQLSFGFQVPTKDSLAGTSNPYIGISINAAGNPVSDSDTTQSLQSVANAKVLIGSGVSLASNGLYYNSPYGSTGPLPPKAGSETTYAIVFTITNTTNKIQNAVVTATMPVYVRSTGKTSPSFENIAFNQDTGEVTWKVGDIAGGVGSGSAPRQVAFEVGFTPSTAQIGQIPHLIRNITLTGTDVSTGEQISIPASDVTTNLVGDTNFTSANATVVAP